MGATRSSGRSTLVIYAVSTKASIPFPCSTCSVQSTMLWPYSDGLGHTILALSSLWPSTPKDSSLISYPGLLYSWVPEGWQGLCSCSSPLTVLWG